MHIVGFDVASFIFGFIVGGVILFIALCWIAFGNRN